MASAPVTLKFHSFLTERIHFILYSQEPKHWLNMLRSSKMNSHQAYWVVYPADSMPNVILVLPLEDQSPIRVILLGGPIQLSVYIRALENAPVLIRVYSLALQGIVHIIALQGAVREGRTKGIVRP